jgi:hypothetical protein
MGWRNAGAVNGENRHKLKTPETEASGVSILMVA